jgi:hypothetical protein
MKSYCRALILAFLLGLGVLSGSGAPAEAAPAATVVTISGYTLTPTPL